MCSGNKNPTPNPVSRKTPSFRQTDPTREDGTCPSTDSNCNL